MKESQSQKSYETPPEVRRILDRRTNEEFRRVYESIAQREQEHQSQCKRARCRQCREAAVLIPHYQAKAKELA